MPTDLLFVYGTLRRAAAGSRHDLLQGAEWVGPAEYQGKLYDLGCYPGVVASDDADDIVHGEIYRMHHSTAVLERLDAYEGCGVYAPAQPEYERVVASVRVNGGGEVRAFLYRYRLPCDGLRRITSGDYLCQI